MDDLELLQLDRSRWPDASKAARQEWWAANGLGGWAGGTVIGANSRTYHALLAAALSPPVGRVVLLAKLEPTLITPNGEFRLYSNYWAGGAIEDDVLRHLHAFRLAPYPVFTFRADGWLVEQRVIPVHGNNATLVRFRLQPGPGAPAPAVLRLRPWVTGRSIHACGTARDWPFTQHSAGSAVRVQSHPGVPWLYLRADAGQYAERPFWVEGVHYPMEEERGLPSREDLFVPGEFTHSFSQVGSWSVLAAIEPLPAGLSGGLVPLAEGQAAQLEQAERNRVRSLLARAAPPDAPSRCLVVAADQFVAKRDSTGTRTVLAGFPWFTDWGRDTMISLPGLALTTRRYDLARELLTTFVWYMHRGLVPNHFPDADGAPQYNTADATLWLFAATWRYFCRTGDKAFVLQRIYPALVRALEHHQSGTDYGIRATPDGLLHCGGPDTQVTWMDAKVDDWVVTPRTGMPVEIQALWYNALRITAELALMAGDDPTPWAELAGMCRGAFRRRFWNAAADCLYDRLASDGTPDPAVRPNQLLAASLDFPLVEGDEARRVVAACWRELWTPYGLRSLSPRDPAYQGRYSGKRRQRDGAYHQGTAWAWLVGPFITAYLNAYGRTPESRAFCRELLRPMLANLCEGAAGSVSEIFDGDPPHTERGCSAQAWSVAELLRVWVEELT